MVGAGRRVQDLVRAVLTVGETGIRGTRMVVEAPGEGGGGEGVGVGPGMLMETVAKGVGVIELTAGVAIAGTERPGGIPREMRSRGAPQPTLLLANPGSSRGLEAPPANAAGVGVAAVAVVVVGGGSGMATARSSTFSPRGGGALVRLVRWGRCPTGSLTVTRTPVTPRGT